MSEQYTIALVGATGAVGRTMLEILEERHFPIKTIFLLASERSAGETLLFKNRPVMVENLAEFDFSQAKIALFSAGSSVSAEYAPKAVKAGCVVVDNTSCFRNEPDVPLVVPEVNAGAISGYLSRGIIANPNCSTMQMVVALKPIYDAVGILRINVATYQSVSGSGQQGITELASQTGELLNGRSIKPSCYPQQIAFNVLPHIDEFQENGYTREEMKMVWETQKIFEDSNIMVNPTAARVPVFYGHSEAVNVETRDKITAGQVRELLKAAPGVKLLDNPKKNKYPTAIGQGSGKDLVYVGRIREDISHSHGINLWIVADNVRKGAALNAVQICEYLVRDYF